MIKINKKFIFFTVVSFIYAYLTGGYLSYSIFYGFLLAIIFSLIYMKIIMKSIEINVEFQEDIFNTFKETEITTVIKNYSFLPIAYMEINNKIMYKLDKSYRGNLVSLKTYENKRLKENIVFNERGLYNFGQFNISIKDIFSILTFTNILNNERIIKVYPKVYSAEFIDLYDKDLTKAIINERGKIEEEYLTTDIRKYRMGDNLKKIHWKISAKHGELYVKNEDTVSGGRVIIFLNMNKEDYSLQYHNEVEEKLISLCVSLVNTMRINGTKVNINISNYEQKSFYIRTKKDFYELMEYFITHKSQGKSNFPNLIIDKISDYKNIVVITPKISKELKEKLIFLSIMKHKVEVFYYSNHSENFDNIISLKQFYIKCVDIRKIYS